MPEKEYVATCLFGLERLLADEIEQLGYTRTETTDGRITFRGDAEAVARLNICLRYAERLYIKMGSFTSESFDALFEGTKAIAWEEYIGASDAFPVKGHAVKSKLFSLPDCQKIVKKAIVERLKSKHGIEWFEETGVKYQVEFFIMNDTATLMIDTSGTPLHKRGYRTESNEAPLRETLAAAVVKLSRPRSDVLLWDPFCGSGTIPVEAALLMTNTAPGISRSFAAEEFAAFPERIWSDARDEAKAAVTDGGGFEAYASDISPKCIEIAKANVKRAGMTGTVKCFVRDALKIDKEDRRATIVTNPPYGERMMTREQTDALYKKMGLKFLTLAPWQIYIISSHEDFEKTYGKKADKLRKLYNGMIKCNLYQYFKN